MAHIGISSLGRSDLRTALSLHFRQTNGLCHYNRPPMYLLVMTKDKLLQVRVTTEEHEQLKALAEKTGLSISTYVRDRVLEEVVSEPKVVGQTEDGHDIVTLPPEKTPDPRLAAEQPACPRCKSKVKSTMKQCPVCSWPLKKK